MSFVSAQVSDAGHYTCVAVNAGGEQHREYELRVYGELKKHNSKPRKILGMFVIHIQFAFCLHR